MTPESADVLARICARKRSEVARRKQDLTMAALRKRIAEAEPPRGFAAALRQMAAARGHALIAEIKKASPSGGLIRPDFDPRALARAYRSGGAACLSVLTDAPYFQGAPEHLAAARTAVPLPVLCKDFILDTWQVYESRTVGADCILLIMAALTDSEAQDFEQLAQSLGMDVLVEVHDRAELERARRLRTTLIGINNRNLKTLRTDLSTTVELAPLLPPQIFVISESGISRHDDLVHLAQAGARGFLVGESLLRHADVTAATNALLGTAAATPLI